MAFKKVKPGHRLYEVDPKTGGIGLAELNPEPVYRKVNEVHKEQLMLRSGVVRFFEREGFLYFSALNVESVRKQFRNLVEKLRNGKETSGFKAVAAKIQKSEGVSAKAAASILASASRNASAKAKAKNPKLNKVKG